MTVARTIKRVMKFTPHHAQQRYRNTSDVSSVLPSTRDWPVRRPVLKSLGLFLERTSREDYRKYRTWAFVVSCCVALSRARFLSLPTFTTGSLPPHITIPQLLSSMSRRCQAHPCVGSLGRLPQGGVRLTGLN